MMTRRKFLQTSTALGCGFAFGTSQANESNIWFMPEESEPHHCTWMAFIADEYVWSKKQIPAVQRNLALIANTIAKYEPVKMLVRPQDKTLARKRLGRQQKYPIHLIEFTMNDLWMRDTAPTFVINERGEKAAVNFNFNGWGEKQAYQHDAKVADFVAKQAGVETFYSDLILEGGCFEVDGQGTAIMTESCILNDNRNPNRSKRFVEDELMHQLGLDKIIWLKGIKDEDITDGHTDFYARFSQAGEVMVSLDNYPSSPDYRITRDNINTLKKATDAQGRPLALTIIETPDQINTQFGSRDFAAGYIGYYVCNNAVIMQKFGDATADENARKHIAAAFPNRVVEQISIDAIASGGGSIHCTTQQEPQN